MKETREHGNRRRSTARARESINQSGKRDQGSRDTFNIKRRRRRVKNTDGESVMCSLTLPPPLLLIPADSPDTFLQAPLLTPCDHHQ